MYEPPNTYECSRETTAEAVKYAQIDILAALYNTALREVAAAANNVGDYLDPNSLRVEVTVKARAL